MKKFLFLLSFLSLFFVIGCGNDEPISKVPYEVIKSEKAGANRLKISIHVKEKVSKDQLQKLADQVFTDQKKTATPFTALFLNFYDNPVYVGQFTPSLGQADFLPNGDIASATTATPGDYKNFKGKYIELKEKDWKKQPTPEEAKIATACFEWLAKQPPSDDDIENQYAKDNKLDPAALKETLNKVLVWTSF